MKQLTEVETYKECLEALERLKVKRLAAGRSFHIQSGCCCSAGALYVHSITEKGVVDLSDYFTNDGIAPVLKQGAYRYSVSTVAREAIIDANDKFSYGNNDWLIQESRYIYMVDWLKREIALAEEVDTIR